MEQRLQAVEEQMLNASLVRDEAAYYASYEERGELRHLLEGFHRGTLGAPRSVAFRSSNPAALCSIRASAMNSSDASDCDGPGRGRERITDLDC